MKRTLPSLKATRKLKLGSPLTKAKQRPRVAVLVSGYQESNSVTKAHDMDHCTPEHYVPPGFPYRFTYHDINKRDGHQAIRKLAMDDADPVHCFFNLCDGALEEDRAGVEVIQALQMFNVPFTGPLPDAFEPHKVTMKLQADKAGVKIPPFALVQKGQDILRKCRHLHYPVIVKHPSGYASVGITRESKCNNEVELEKQVKKFIGEHDVALIEEFITGREGTVLVCRDDKTKDGVRVFPPIIMEFPGGVEDFQSFDNKWVLDWYSDPTRHPKAFDINDAFYPKIIELARRAYTAILGGTGYGRVDFRLDERNGTNEAYFLEINPNCGMFYPPSMGGDYADIMVAYDKDWDHATFIRHQIEYAVKDHRARQTWWRPTVDANRNFVTKATQSTKPGTRVFGSEESPVLLRMSVNKTTGLPSCIAVQGDRKARMVALRHSCRPNIGLLQGTTLELVAQRPLRSGDILSIDYALVRDTTMPSFSCKCGAPNCRGKIRARRPTLRTMPLRRKQLEAAKQRLVEAKRKGASSAPNANGAKPSTTATAGALASSSSAATVSGAEAAEMETSTSSTSSSSSSPSRRRTNGVSTAAVGASGSAAIHGSSTPDDTIAKVVKA